MKLKSLGRNKEFEANEKEAQQSVRRRRLSFDDDGTILQFLKILLVL